MEINRMDLINAQIEYGAKGTTNKEITQNILNEWRNSEPIKYMVLADKYSKVQNTAIDNKTRSYYDEDGHVVDNNSVSNVKSKTARYRKSLNQKLNYALSKPFVVSCEDKAYGQLWEDFLTDDIRGVIKRCGKSAINKGIAYIYPYIDKDGNLQLLNMVSETIYPAWADTEHLNLDAIVRDYSIIEYTNQTPTVVRKVEFWDKEIVEKFIDYSSGDGNGALEADIDKEYELDDEETSRASIFQSHMVDSEGNGISWNKVPFIFFKGNDDELSLLAECKTDVDAYDMLKSKAIDSLLDDIDAILVIKNIGAEMGELTRARKIVQNSRIVAVDSTGDAHFEKVNADVNAIVQQLDLIKKDIQDDTSTVDLTTIQLGTNPSGEAMKAFYESLDTWADGFESEFRLMMFNLKYFFDMWLSFQGGHGTFEELQKKKVTFSLNRNMMINESTVIDNIIKLQDQLSQETKDELNPYVESHSKEQERRDKEEQTMLENQDLVLQQQNFNQNLDNLDQNDPNNKF